MSTSLWQHGLTVNEYVAMYFIFEDKNIPVAAKKQMANDFYQASFCENNTSQDIPAKAGNPNSLTIGASGLKPVEECQ